MVKGRIGNSSYSTKSSSKLLGILRKNINKYKQVTKSGLVSKVPSQIRTTELRRIGKIRGEQVRYLRRFMGMTIASFSRTIQMNSATLGRIERGHTCLSIEMANWITNRAVNAGYFASISWLLTGQGDRPKRMQIDDFNVKDFLFDLIKKKISKDIDNSTLKLLSQFLIYKLQQDFSYNKETVMVFVRDNKMFPIVVKGQIVIACGLSEEKKKNLQNQLCVITFLDSSIQLVRHVSCTKEDNAYSFFAFSVDGSSPEKLRNIDKIYAVVHIIYDADCEFDFLSVNKDLLSTLDEKLYSEFE